MKKFLLLCVLCAVMCASVACVQWPHTYMKNGVYVTTDGQMTVYQLTAGTACGTRLLPDGTTEEIYLTYMGRNAAKIYRIADFWDGERIYADLVKCAPIYVGTCEVYDNDEGLSILLRNGTELLFERQGDVPEDYKSPISIHQQIPNSDTTENQQK